MADFVEIYTVHKRALDGTITSYTVDFERGEVLSACKDCVVFLDPGVMWAAQRHVLSEAEYRSRFAPLARPQDMV